MLKDRKVEFYNAPTYHKDVESVSTALTNLRTGNSHGERSIWQTAVEDYADGGRYYRATAVHHSTHAQLVKTFGENLIAMLGQHKGATEAFIDKVFEGENYMQDGCCFYTNHADGYNVRRYLAASCKLADDGNPAVLYLRTDNEGIGQLDTPAKLVMNAQRIVDSFAKRPDKESQMAFAIGHIAKKYPELKVFA